MTATATAPVQHGEVEDALLGNLTISLEMQAGLPQAQTDELFATHRGHVEEALAKTAEKMADHPDKEFVISIQTTAGDGDGKFTLLSVMTNEFRWTRGDSGAPSPEEAEAIARLAAMASKLSALGRLLQSVPQEG